MFCMINYDFLILTTINTVGILAFLLYKGNKLDQLLLVLQKKLPRQPKRQAATELPNQKPVRRINFPPYSIKKSIWYKFHRADTQRNYVLSIMCTVCKQMMKSQTQMQGELILASTKCSLIYQNLNYFEVCKLHNCQSIIRTILLHLKHTLRSSQDNQKYFDKYCTKCCRQNTFLVMFSQRKIHPNTLHKQQDSNQNYKFNIEGSKQNSLGMNFDPIYIPQHKRYNLQVTQSKSNMYFDMRDKFHFQQICNIQFNIAYNYFPHNLSSF